MRVSSRGWLQHSPAAHRFTSRCHRVLAAAPAPPHLPNPSRPRKAREHASTPGQMPCACTSRQHGRSASCHACSETSYVPHYQVHASNPPKARALGPLQTHNACGKWVPPGIAGPVATHRPLFIRPLHKYVMRWCQYETAQQSNATHILSAASRTAPACSRRYHVGDAPALRPAIPGVSGDGSRGRCPRTRGGPGCAAAAAYTNTRPHTLISSQARVPAYAHAECDDTPQMVQWVGWW